MELKRRAMDAAGRMGRHVPIDSVQLFSFVASPAARTNPWPLYRSLHRRGGVIETKFGVTVVASHADANAILRHPDTSVREDLAEGLPADDGDDGPFSELMHRTLLFIDPPDHARLRRLVARAFTPKTVEQLRPAVEELVREMVDGVRPSGRADVVSELALPLPVAVICELLGVPRTERRRLLHWARDLAPRLDVSLFRDAGKERRGDDAARELVRFLGELIDDPHRRAPDGLISALVAVEEANDHLSRDEVIALCSLLLVAGFETTTNLISNGMLALLRHPEQLRRVREGDVEPAVMADELLRFDGPVQMTQRVPLVDLELATGTIPARRLVAVLVGAANRDPLVFTEPDRLDIGRTPNPHVAFGSGIHHCIGASLARLEVGVAVPALITSLPNLRLAARPRWRDTFVLRGLTTLPIAWDP
jgi:cytochrome P450